MAEVRGVISQLIQNPRVDRQDLSERLQDSATRESRTVAEITRDSATIRTQDSDSIDLSRSARELLERIDGARRSSNTGAPDELSRREIAAIEDQQAQRIRLANAGSGSDEIQTDRFFSQLDKDGNGSVTESEFFAWLNSIAKPQELSEREFQALKDDATSTFYQAAALPGGEAVVSRRQEISVSFAQYQQLFADGADNTLAERLRLANADAPTSRPNEIQTDRFFSQVDKDGNGTITEREFFAWLNNIDKPEELSGREFQSLKDDAISKFFEAAALPGGEQNRTQATVNFEQYQQLLALYGAGNRTV